MGKRPKGEKTKRGKDLAPIIHLLDKVDGWLEIQAKVNELPLNALLLILLLLQDEHRVVEQLLQLFVGVVDAQLLEAAKEDKVS